MAGKSDFTDTEWTALQHGLAGTLLLVSVSDPGLFDTFKEAGAAARHYGDARRSSESALVRDLAADPGLGFGFGMSPQELETQTLAALTSAAAAVQQKAPDELAAFRQFVVDVAQSVAGAAKGTSESETAVVAKIQGALGS
jgi:hypothetical protein